MPELCRTALPPSRLGGLGGQHPVGACGRALRARVGVAGMQRGAWQTAAVMEEAGGGGRAGRGACVRVRGWVVRVDLPVRCVRGHRAEQNASWERMAALAGLCQRRRPPHMTPQPPGTSNRWNTHILGWNTGRVRPGLVRPRRPLRREPPDLALSAPFRGRVAASPGLHVAATPTARCTASGVRPARRGGACRPRLSGPAEHVSGASSKSRQILPSRRRSTAARRPRPGCTLPRHPPRGALHPGSGQLVGGARVALDFRGLRNTFREEQAGPLP